MRFLGFILIVILFGSCKKKDDIGTNDITKTDNYFGDGYITGTNFKEGTRVLFSIDTSNSTVEKFDLAQTFYVRDNFEIDTADFFNSKNNSLVKYIQKFEPFSVARKDVMQITYSLGSRWYYRYNQNYNSNYAVQVASFHGRLQNGKITFWDAVKNQMVNNQKSYFDDAIFVNDKICNTQNVASISCKDYTIGGHSSKGGTIDAFGNVIYSNSGDIHYIKSGGGILEVGSRPKRIYAHVDGNIYLHFDNNLKIRIDGKSYTLDSLYLGTDFIPPQTLGAVWMSTHNKWISGYAWYDLVNKTATPTAISKPAKHGLTGNSNAFHFRIEGVDLGKNKLFKIDPVTGSMFRIGDNYDIFDFVVNEDGGGVFVGLSFNDGKNYVCGFDSNGFVRELYSYNGIGEVRLVNLRKSHFPTW